MAGIFDIFTGQSGVDAANAQKAGIAAGQTAATTALNQGQNALTTNAGAAQGALTAGAGAAQGALATNAGAAQGALSTNYAAGLQPYLQNYATANKGVGGLTDALGLTGDPSQVMARLQQTPGYQFQLQQGDENVLRNQARTGALNSGATNLDLQAQGQGLANQTYQQYIQNLQPFLGASNSAAGGIANLDAGLGAGSANISTGLGKDSANISTGLGTGSANLSTGLGTALNQNFGSQANLGYTSATGIGNANANADLAQGKGIANLWGAGMGLAELAAGLPPTGFGGGGGSGGGDTSVYGAGGSAYGATPQAVNGGVFPQFAEGGKPPVGQPSVVGERGPELFVPDQPGTVVPNDLVQRLLQFLPGQSLGNSAGGSRMTYDSGQPLTPNDYVSEGFKAHDPATTPPRQNEPRPFQWPPHIPGAFADGGRPPAGQTSIVGERGPELFVPDQPGAFVPNSMAQKFLQFMPGQSSGPAQASSNPSSMLARFLRAA